MAPIKMVAHVRVKERFNALSQARVGVRISRFIRVDVRVGADEEELKRLRAMIQTQGMIIEDLRKESATHLRRCAELQADVDIIKKALSATSTVTV